MTPLEELRAAGIDVRLDPATPFGLRASSPTPEQIALLTTVLAAHRDEVVAEALSEMTAADFDAFLDDAVADRHAEQSDPTVRWMNADKRWGDFRRVLDDEDERRRLGHPYRPTPTAAEAEHGRRATEKERLLTLLQAAGKRGVLNGELEAGEVGRRYSARLEELRREGWAIDTERVDARNFKFILRGRRMFEEGAA